MRRTAVTSLVLLACFAAAPPTGAHTPTGRIVVIALDGTDLADWRRANVPEIDRLLDSGASGLLSARTASPTPATIDGCMARGQSAIRTMLEGRPSRGGDFEERNTALSRMLSEHNLFLGIARGTVADGSFPGGTRANIPIFLRALGRAPSVAIFPVIDTLAADCRTSGSERARWVDLSLRRLAPLIAAAQNVADHVVVASTIPPIRRQRAGNHLGVIAIGGGSRRGTLRSETTDRRGVVTLQDFAATALDVYGIGTRLGTGSAMRASGTTDIDGLAGRFHHALRLQGPFVTGLSVAAATLMIAAFLLIASGRRARALRSAVGVALCAAAAVPAATLIEAIPNTETTLFTALTVPVVACALVLFGYVTRGIRRSIALVGAATTILVALDGVLQGALSSKGILSSGVAEGVRFSGYDEVMFGALIAGTLIWAAAALDAEPRSARGVLAIIGVAAFIALLPSQGARAELPVAALLIFGYAVRMSDRVRIDRVVGTAVAIATLLAAGVVAALDHDPGVPVPIASWIAAPAAATAIALVLGARRRALLARGFWGRPHLRYALAACAAGSAAAAGTDGGGVVTAATIALIAGPAFLGTLLTQD